MDATTSLVRMETPPVRETAMAIEFIPMTGFGVVQLVHLSDFWQQRFPTTQEQPPLPPEGEIEGDWDVSFNPFTGIRLWLEEAGGHLLVQIQNDRLVLNWRSEAPDSETRAPYPGYDELRPTFTGLWSEFLTFLERNSLEPPRPRIVEFAYVNRVSTEREIPLAKALSVLQPPTGEMPVEETGSTFRTERTLAEGGMVTVLAQHASRLEEWGLTISARLPGSESRSPLDVMDEAHEAAKATFFAITSVDAQQVWGEHD